MRHRSKSLATPSYQHATNALLFAMLVAAAYLLFASQANATMIGTSLCNVAIWMYNGNIGKGISTLAICIIGIGATLGKVSWGLAMVVGVGIVVIFNAHLIATALGQGCP